MMRCLKLLFAVVLVAASRLERGHRRCFAFLKRREPFLIEFGGKTVAEETKKMNPLVRQIERKLNTRMVRYDIYNDHAAYKLWLFLDKNPRGASMCGGLPFYYNRKTGGIVCGPTTYENLENWATGQAHKIALPPTISQEEVEIRGRVTGAKARIMRQNKQQPGGIQGTTSHEVTDAPAASRPLEMRPPVQATAD